MDRKLLDEDGENQAVRMFLMAYGEPGLTVARMRRHMELAGWTQAPEWALKPEAQGHLTKGGAQDWLRHLFSLEASTPHQEVGEAGKMPGTDGFTMACFHAEKVPLGTKLYTQPQPR